jgi:hypothetical protein
MLYWILQNIILSIIFIFLIHHIFIFFKNNLTVPKVKDLVNIPSQKYKNMLNVISKSERTDEEIVNNVEYTIDDLLPKPDINEMKNELKNFLKEQINTSENNYTPEIDGLKLDSMGEKYYSSYYTF